MELKPIESIKTINELNEYRKQFENALNEREAFINKCVTAKMLSEGTFYEIKENFESLSPKLFKTDNGKSLLNKYKKVVKENSNLSSLYSLYENIRKANKSVELDYFVNSLSEKKWISDKDTLCEDIKKLGNVLAEAYIEVGNTSDIKHCDKKLDEAVRYIVENKRNDNNISEYSGAIKIIKDYIGKKDGEIEVVNENINLDDYASKLIKNFNEKYSENKLSNDELAIMREFCNSQNHEEIFEQHKEQCKNKLTEAMNKFLKDGDNTSVNKLTNILEQVNSKTYNSNNVFTDVVSLIGLTNIFDKNEE